MPDVLVDALALYVLHDQIRAPLAGMAGIEDLHDGGVMQGSEHLPLVQETVAPTRVPVFGAEKFDGDLPADLAIVSLTQIHRRHAAGPQPADQTIGPASHLRRSVRGM